MTSEQHNASEYEAGRRDAMAEIVGGWTVEIARAYLASVTPREDAYSRGFDDAVRAWQDGR